MEGEILVVTSSQGTRKDLENSSSSSNGGIVFINLSTGTLYSQQMKNCLCPTQGITATGGISSFSGLGGCGDYIIAAQSKKPQINVWQWGKPHALMQCHVQEITTAIASDMTGFYLCGGTKGGRIFLWELSSGALVQSWQAHFKSLTTVTFSSCCNFLISTSEDGMIRVWDVVNILNSERKGQSDNQMKSFTPYRSWTPHTLSVTGLSLLSTGGACSATRILTTSLDRTVAIYDLHSNRVLSTKAYPEALTCCTVNPSYDFAYLGSMSGVIYTLALSHVAVIISEANWKLGLNESRNQSGFPSSTQRSLHTVSQFLGHDKPITALSHSRDNVTLVSASQDGHVRIWNTISRQCMLMVDPFSLSPINNAFIILKPEVFDPSGSQEVHRPTLAPIGHLKKYKSTAQSPGIETSESSQSAESKIGTRISFNSTKTTEGHTPSLQASVHFHPCGRAVSDGGSLDDMNSQYIELPKGESSSQGGIDLPGKIRRQDTFGDEFYESWEKNVSVESTQTATGGNQDSDGFLSFATNSEGGQKRYREVEDEGKEIEEAESVDEDEDDADYLRNEVEKWKQLAGELKDQVLHLRATVSPAGSNRSGNQQKRKKLKRGLRYHQAAATEEVDCEAENDSMPTTPQSSTPRTPPSSFNQSPRQSKATPPKSKSMKRGNLS